MAHTDKDLPLWVREGRDGLVVHDHRRGVCITETHPREGRYGYWPAARHAARCCKRSVTLRFCAASQGPPAGSGCWGTELLALGALDEAGLPRPVDPRCPGHRFVIVDAAAPCGCDTFGPRPTCVSVERRPRRRSDSTWWGDGEVRHAERVRERDTLGELRKAFNAVGARGGLDGHGAGVDEDAWGVEVEDLHLDRVPHR